MKIDKNLPNYLTILRILVIPVIITSFYFRDSRFAHQLGGIIFALASITDFLDGYLARKFNVISNFGRMLDPIADKVLVGCVILMLVKNTQVHVLPCLLILAREFIIAGMREFLAKVQVSVPVSRLARIKTFIQMLALTILIIGSTGSGIEYFDAIGQFFLWVAAILTLITSYSYLKATGKYL